jgi:hypothetical protein
MRYGFVPTPLQTFRMESGGESNSSSFDFCLVLLSARIIDGAHVIRIREMNLLRS